MRTVFFAISVAAWSLPGICDRLVKIPLDAVVASSEVIADVELVQGRRGDLIGNGDRDSCGYFYKAALNKIYKGVSRKTLQFYSKDQLTLGGRYLVFFPLKKEGSIRDLNLPDASKAKIERFETLREERTTCRGMPVLSESLPPRIMLIDVDAYIALGAPHVRIVLPSALGTPRSIDRIQVILEFEQIGKGDLSGRVATYEWLPYDALIRAIRSSAENDR